jgi:chorismate mutase/prephenate dehydratase
VQISGEVQLRIHHTLLGRGSRSGIKKVCSKPQALSQCRGWLAKNLPSAELVATTSTTAAAEQALANTDVAAIASREAGVQYGLPVLASNIEDNKANVTRFAMIGNASAARTGNDKTALLFKLPHQPGALADAMGVFRRKRLNLTWIESFPLMGQPNEYLFFVELQGHEKDLRVRQALASLEKKTELLEVLGSYASTKPVD